MPGPPEQLRGPHPHLYSRDVAARIGSPLPEAARAIIEEHKLRDYLLNPDHQDGRHKARVFASALGISGSAAAPNHCVRRCLDLLVHGASPPDRQSSHEHA